MKFALVQDRSFDKALSISVCDTLEELLTHPFNLPVDTSPPRIHKVPDGKVKPTTTLVRYIRQQTRARAYYKLPI